MNTFQHFQRDTRGVMDGRPMQIMLVVSVLTAITGILITEFLVF